MRKNILILGHNDATQFIDIYNQYTRLFDQQYYEVTVAYLTGPENAETRQRTMAENVLFLNIPKKDIRMLKIGAIRRLLALCREKQFQIAICHRYKPTYIMMWVTQFYRLPALIGVMHELGTMSSRGRQWFMAALARRNMLFAGVSNAVRDDMRKDLWGIPKERVVTLYNVVDVEQTEPQFFSREEARQALHLSADDIVFGNLARLVPNKDHASLIQAFSLIKADCPKAKLVIMGEGELAASLQEQVRSYQLSDDVIFTGFVANGFRYMKAFDGFVLSSIQEAFGRVLIEAMTAKLPIIATRVHGIPEVMGETGLVVSPKDVVALSSAMKKIYTLSPEERGQWGKRGYQWMMENFSISSFQKQFWQLPLMQSLKE
ncbi:MAG: glycosyltransferase [Gammaproteobacteria bacterium]|nr:MAG: glycosyltransferase [Gammaproteobacteria bacterium]